MRILKVFKGCEGFEGFDDLFGFNDNEDINDYFVHILQIIYIFS